MKALPAELVLYDGGDSIVLRPFNPKVTDPVICTSWDLGAPDVRVTSTARPGSDGTDDGPGFLGARIVSFELTFMGADPYAAIDRIAALSHPGRRPTLQLTRTVGKPWTLGLRGIPFSVTYNRQAAGRIQATVTFSAPLGFLEGPLLGPFITPAVSGLLQTDWKFPAKFSKTFGAGTFTFPTITVNVGGSVPIGPLIYFFGPSKDPKVYTEDREVFAFKGLTLSDGQSVQVDMGAGTIRSADAQTGVVNESSSLFSVVDFEQSTFWQWNPGVHVMHYQGASGSVAVQYRERRLNF